MTIPEMGYHADEDFVLCGLFKGTIPYECCKFRKVEAVAESYLFGMMLQVPDKYPVIAKMEPSEKLVVARGVKIIQETLADEVETYRENGIQQLH